MEKYKDSDHGAKAFREGYDELSKDNRVLLTDKVELQANVDELKERERISKEQKSSAESRLVDQPSVTNPNVSSAATFDRQVAELEHLGGLVVSWQTRLEHATAERDGSRNRKNALEGKVRDAEQQLKKLKTASPSKTQRASNTKSNPESAREEEQNVLGGTGNDRGVLQPSVKIPGTLFKKARVAAEALSCTELSSSTQSYSFEHLEEPSPC
ncbi:hypothetical protein BKA58DRAFT_455070 [Alternaria rosae]|uniref:uncharacterized protein n=1 Tax=Alternaria rosae TaxID=1187941 RepID=UPI001E8DF4BC|nr:uncharacterized protein BKA58DRAFT_455070 [Alternaria rosae]KAH6876034.1 hypothetical protein BKA58DRAFT_455070 [Alternaria rosae]